MSAATTTTELTALPRSTSLPTFFDNLDSFAEAPEGVAKLRAFVLDLAVRGKLVEQDDNDEPAAELLEEIAAERDRLIKAKKIKRTKLLPRVENGEQPFDLPTGWEWVRVDRVFLVVTDGDHRAPPRADDGIPFLVIGNVRNGDLNFTNTRFVRRDYFEELDPLRKPTRGDLLYTVTGSYGIPVAVKSDRPFCVQRHIGILKPPCAVNVEFLHRVLSSGFVFDQATACATGIAQKTVPLAGLRKTMIPLPPLSEQRRIVSKVDGLMSLCDELDSRAAERVRLRERASRSCLDRLVSAHVGERNGASRRSNRAASDSAKPAASALPLTETVSSAWQRLSDHFEVLYACPEPLAHLRQSILQLAVQGKLVPQDPNDEPASFVVERLATSNGQTRKSKFTPIRENGELFPAPNGWEWRRLGEICEFLGGYAYKSTIYVPASENQIIRLGNVKNNQVLLGQKPAFVPDEIADETPEFRIYPNDLLITMTGTKKKRDYLFTTLVSDETLADRRLYLNQRVGLLRFNDALTAAVANIFLKADCVLDFMFAQATGTANQGNIGKGAICDAPFPLPPLAEQKRIVAKVDQLLSQCDELSARLRDRQSATHGLLTATIHQILESTASAQRDQK